MAPTVTALEMHAGEATPSRALPLLSRHHGRDAQVQQRVELALERRRLRVGVAVRLEGAAAAEAHVHRGHVVRPGHAGDVVQRQLLVGGVGDEAGGLGADPAAARGGVDPAEDLDGQDRRVGGRPRCRVRRARSGPRRCSTTWVPWPHWLTPRDMQRGIALSAAPGPVWASSPLGHRETDPVLASVVEKQAWSTMRLSQKRMVAVDAQVQDGDGGAAARPARRVGPVRADHPGAVGQKGHARPVRVHGLHPGGSLRSSARVAASTSATRKPAEADDSSTLALSRGPLDVRGDLAHRLAGPQLDDGADLLLGPDLLDQAVADGGTVADRSAGVPRGRRAHDRRQRDRAGEHRARSHGFSSETSSGRHGG
ncbi:hypothetical protein ACFSTC_06900 [Nonomuraea ferruginea]